MLPSDPSHLLRVQLDLTMALFSTVAQVAKILTVVHKTSRKRRRDHNHLRAVSLRFYLTADEARRSKEPKDLGEPGRKPGSRPCSVRNAMIGMRTGWTKEPASAYFGPSYNRLHAISGLRSSHESEVYRPAPAHRGFPNGRADSA